MSLPPAVIRDITWNFSVTSIASRTANRFEISSVTLTNTRIRIDISILVIGNTMR